MNIIDLSIKYSFVSVLLYNPYTLCIFIDWLDNHNTPWATYCAFISVQIIALDKQPGVCPVGAGETWRRIFSTCVLRIMVSEATNAWKNDQICSGLKAVIDGDVHGAQSLWDDNLSSDNWAFLLVDAKMSWTR